MNNRPLDPTTAALRKAMSRRGFLGAAGALGAGAALAACGTGGSGGAASSAAPSFPADVSDSEKIVRWLNWPDYLDTDDAGNYPSLQKFEKATGIKATYAADYNDNDETWGKVNGQLSRGQDIGFDIVTPTDWMANRFIQFGYVQPLDPALIPNKGNILDSLANVGFDPGRKYSMTWQSGFAGIVYNKAEVKGGIKTVEELFTRPDLKGRVTVLSEMRDTMGIILQSQGIDIAAGISEEQFQAGLDVLDKAIADGQVYKVQGNEYRNDLRDKKALAGIVWSGDIFIANAEEGNQWEFLLPESGGTLWSDNMLIPNTSNHQKNAQALINHYYDPAIAAEVAAWVNYICPVKGAREEMEKIDPALASSPFIFPDDTTLSKSAVFPPLDAQTEQRFNELWATTAGV